MLAGAHGLRLVLEGRRDRPRRSAGPSRPTRTQYQRLHNLVEGLCIASGLPKPGVYVVDDPAPERLRHRAATRKHAAIAVTTGLLEKMNRVELEGVLAHELSHIKNYDILVSTLAVTLVGAVALLADIGDPHDVVERRPRSAAAATSDDGGNPLAYRRLRPADPRRRSSPRLMQATISPQAARRWPTSAPAS